MKIQIGIIGDYKPQHHTHTATDEGLIHAAEALGLGLSHQWLPTQELQRDVAALADFDGLWCAPASPYHSEEGAFAGIQFAREGGVPFLGT